MKRYLRSAFSIVTAALLIATSASAQLKTPQTKAPPAKLPPQATKVLTPPRPADGFQNWGFELGTLEGWTKSGTAFDRQPTFDNNVAARRPDVDLGHEGNYWIGTFENRPNETARFGGTQGDEKTGRLISPDFKVETRYISFLIGGGAGTGSGETLMVRLMGLGASGEAAQLKVAQGWDDESMQRVVWDVYALRGRRARIEIIDEATGPWGHINVDDFQFSDMAPVNARAAEMPARQVVRKGRFRVTVNGFIAHEQTWDDATQRDGKDDEVFIVGETRVLKTGSEIPEVITLPQVRSVIMGDIQGFDDRASAGSASALGGIKSGDRVPRETPWVRTRQPGARGLPFILWEGELVADGIAVVIAPTIWEWDGDESPLASLLRKIDVIETAFEGDRILGVDDRTANRAGASLLRRASEVQIGQNVVGTSETFERSAIVGLAADRPIGLTWDPDRYRFGFDPWVLPLTYDKALAASQTDYGRGNGVIEVNYFDATELRGRYTLFVQIEQLP